MLLTGIEFFFGVLFFGLGFILLWALVTEMIQRSVEWYRGMWGLEARLRREWEALTPEERRYFDEEMERLHIDRILFQRDGWRSFNGKSISYTIRLISLVQEGTRSQLS